MHAEWARRVGAEYRSAGVAAQVMAWGIGVGLPVALVRVAGRVVNDELDHAEGSHRALVALGGADTPVDLPPEGLVTPGGANVLADLARLVLRESCFGETLAVPLFAEMRRRADQPAVAPILDRILADEALHRTFGWEVLDAIITIDAAVVPYLAAQLPAIQASFAGYAAPLDAPPLSAVERGCGLLENEEYGAIYARAWTEDLAPRLRRRGLLA